MWRRQKVRTLVTRFRCMGGAGGQEDRVTAVLSSHALEDLKWEPASQQSVCNAGMQVSN